MNRQNAIQILQEALPGFRDRFGVADLALFGSVARNEAGPDSDIDILVTFEGPATMKRYMGLYESLVALFGERVDLATQKSVSPMLRTYIEKDLVHVP